MGNCVSIEEDSQIQGRRMRTNPNPDTNLDAGQAVLTTPKKSSPKINGVISVLAAPKGVEDLRQIGDYGNVNTFTYAELGAATKNFRPDQVLGEGGFGMVYKGLIDQTVRPGFTSTQVAVKVLNREGFQGDKEWLVIFVDKNLSLHSQWRFHLDFSYNKVINSNNYKDLFDIFRLPD